MSALDDQIIEKQASEIKRLRALIDTCAHKIELMLSFGQLNPRHEIDELLKEMRQLEQRKLMPYDQHCVPEHERQGPIEWPYERLSRW